MICNVVCICMYGADALRYNAMDAGKIINYNFNQLYLIKSSMGLYFIGKLQCLQQKQLNVIFVKMYKTLLKIQSYLDQIFASNTGIYTSLNLFLKQKTSIIG